MQQSASFGQRANRPPHPFWLQGLVLVFGGVWLLEFGAALALDASSPAAAFYSNFAATDSGVWLELLATLPVAVGSCLLLVPSEIPPPDGSRPVPVPSGSAGALAAAVESLAGVLLVVFGVWASDHCTATYDGYCWQTWLAPLGALTILAGVSLATWAIAAQAIPRRLPGGAPNPLRRRAARLLLHGLSLTAGVSLAVALVLVVLVFPWLLGPVVIDDSSTFTSSELIDAATIFGDVHVKMTGSWSASAPTDQFWTTSGLSAEGPCQGGCPPGALNGTLTFSVNFCTQWATSEGGSYNGASTLTLYLLFLTPSGGVDQVTFDLTVVVDGSAQSCAT